MTLRLVRGLPFPEFGMLLRSPFITLDRTRVAALETNLRRQGTDEVSVQLPKVREAFPALAAMAGRLPNQQQPRQWSATFSKLLGAAGWPGERTLSDEEASAVEQWKDLLSDLAALDLVLGLVSFAEALTRLRGIAAQCQLARNDTDAPIQILDLQEAVGLRFDAFWIAGLHGSVWPAPPRPTPFLPLALQRAAGTPHGSPERELAYARQLTEGLFAAASEVVVSYPLAAGEETLRPSPLIDSLTDVTSTFPDISFLVQPAVLEVLPGTPAGSGKTEVLIQRFLCLLAVVTRPEAIVAITFTRKAAGEMRERILGALRDAQQGRAKTEPHEILTQELAAAALNRDQELGWDLLHHPGRLRVQTIDSLCMAIAGEMPWLSRLGAMPDMEDDCRPLFEEAARRTLLLEGGEDYRESWEILLRHLDNNVSHVQGLIVGMLGSREQWIKYAVQTVDEDRRAMEAALGRAITRELTALNDLVPASLRPVWVSVAHYAAANMEGDPGYAALQDLITWPTASVDDLPVWQALANTVLTNSGDWRKSLTKACGFPTTDRAKKQEALDLLDALRNDGLLEALNRLRRLPPARYTDRQWRVMRALLEILRLAVGHLRVVFRENRIADFTEIGMAARQALGPPDNPTDLAFRMDSRIEHLLVDEFQDTSRGQFELLERLTAGWQPGDGRTLFGVGDPMQSIYRFRQAEVGLFLDVEQEGLGDLRPEKLELVLNYRSREVVVERVNSLVDPIFPKTSDAATGAILFTRSYAMPSASGGEVVIEGVSDDASEARRVVALIRSAREADPQGNVAILVRARTHLPAIVAAIKAEGLPFRAVDIDPLQERSTVRDLLVLTRAMLHHGDRISWLAILRAPWCGLTLPDLEALVGTHRTQPVWHSLQDLTALSADGQGRVGRLRAVLASAFEEQGRWPLRRWVERAWKKLGGPECVAGDPGALQDAMDYLDRLEGQQSGADLTDLDGFTIQLEALFAKPAPAQDPWLHVMTIHKAKGLGFDTVILPGLGRRERNDGAPLALIHEWREDDAEEVLLAPVSERRGDDDPMYRYLQHIESRKARLERARLLYVALTRARKRLCLLGQVKAKKSGEVMPSQNCMLFDLWGALTDAERASFHQESQDASTADTPAPANLRRLPLSWQLAPLRLPVAWLGSDDVLPEPHTPTFERVGESLRRAGTVVHAFLQRMPPGHFAPPTLEVVRRALAHAGVMPQEIAATAQRVERAFARMRKSSHGQWILAAHTDTRCEYAVAGVVDGHVIRGTVDRTFIDERGDRWIIDFKTSSHEGGGLREFLDEQQRRYLDQMERYGRIFSMAETAKVRLGLYFPLLDELRTWDLP